MFLSASNFAKLQCETFVALLCLTWFLLFAEPDLFDNDSRIAIVSQRNSFDFRVCVKL